MTLADITLQGYKYRYKKQPSRKWYPLIIPIFVEKGYYALINSQISDFLRKFEINTVNILNKSPNSSNCIPIIVIILQQRYDQVTFISETSFEISHKIKIVCCHDL